MGALERGECGGRVERVEREERGSVLKLLLTL